MTFTTRTGQKIQCDSIAAFVEIREKYFPEIPVDRWRIVGFASGLTTLVLHQLLSKEKGNG